MATKTKRTAEDRKAEADALHAQIAAKVDTLAADGEWLAYLKFMQSFHSYSFNNTILMMVQSHVAGRPMPTLVAGYGQWQDKGYQVRKGETGMRIFGFSKRAVRDPQTGEHLRDAEGKLRYSVWFPVVSVFDVAQVDPNTEERQVRRGKSFKTMPVAQPLGGFSPELLTGEDQLGLRDKVAEFVRAHGWEFAVEPVEGSANGYTTLDGSKRVVVDAALEPAQQAKTALHEAAHMLLHATADGQVEPTAPTQRAVLELEAESVAYVVGGLLGLDTEQYSDKYLLGWGSKVDAENPGEAIRATAERVSKAVKTLVAALGGAADEDAGEAAEEVAEAA